MKCNGAALPARSGGVAFIGFGNYAKGTLLPAFRKADGIKLTTVVTSTGISAGHAGEKYGFATVATEAEAALNDASASMIVIATRHDTHAGPRQRSTSGRQECLLRKAARHGHGGSRRVLASAGGAPGVLTVGFNRRFAPLLVKAKYALEPRSGPLVMLYRVNAGAIPAENWIQREEGGGRIVGEVCHFVDALTFLCGSVPIEVQAVAARDHSDAVSILLRFADGSTGTIVYSSIGDPAVSKEYIEVFASGRVVQLDDFRKLTVTAGGKTSSIKGNQDKGQHALVRAFIAAARGEGPAPIPLAELAAVTEATFAIEDSLRLGAVVALES